MPYFKGGNHYMYCQKFAVNFPSKPTSDGTRIQLNNRKRYVIIPVILKLTIEIQSVQIPRTMNFESETASFW